MIAGRLPFEGLNTNEIIASILSDKEPTPLARYARGVPTELERIVEKSLRKDREQRYQTIKDMLLDLKSLKQHLDFTAELERSQPPQMGNEKAVPGAARATVSLEALQTAPVTESLMRKIKHHRRGLMMARAVLMGRMRQIGDTLNIQVDLVDATTGAQLWGEEYERKVSDVLSIKQVIAREVTEKLRLRLSGQEQQRLVKHDTTNAEAYQLYLQGEYLWYKWDDKSLELYQRAIAKDPKFALA